LVHPEFIDRISRKNAACRGDRTGHIINHRDSTGLRRSNASPMAGSGCDRRNIAQVQTRVEDADNDEQKKRNDEGSFNSYDSALTPQEEPSPSTTKNLRHGATVAAPMSGGE